MQYGASESAVWVWAIPESDHLRTVREPKGSVPSLLTAPAIVLYAQSFRFAWETRHAGDRLASSQSEAV